MPTFRGIEDSTGHVYDVEDAYARTQASAASAAASAASAAASAASAAASDASSTAAEAASKAEGVEQSVNALESKVDSQFVNIVYNDATKVVKFNLGSAS